MDSVHLYAFGSPHIVRADGQPALPDTRKATALLVYLALERRPHQRDALAALLWPDYDQEHARATLRRTLSSLTKAVDVEIVRAERDALSVAEEAPLCCDVLTFRARVAACMSHGHARGDVCGACVPELEAALALYRDDFLAGFGLRDSASFEDWQCVQRDALRSELASVLRRLARAKVTEGAYSEAIPLAQRWLALDPLHEPAYRALMRLYTWTRQPGQALRLYRACAEVLDRELGVAPLDTTSRLAEAIRAYNPPAAPTPRQLPPPNTAGTPAGPAPSTPPVTIPRTDTETRARPYLPERAPLYDRAQDLQAALASYRASGSMGDDASQQISGRLLVIEGEAGIGKTRLAEEVVAVARGAGGKVIVVRCYEGEAALAYAPVAAAIREAIPLLAADGQSESAAKLLPGEWISEAARLVPELSLHGTVGRSPAAAETTGLVEATSAQTRFYEALRQVLISALAADCARPGMLWCDDAQWADEASLSVIAYIARRLTGVPLCLVLAWRSSDVSMQHRLRQVLAEATRAGHATCLRLGRLSRDAVGAWAAETLSLHPGTASLDVERLAGRLHAETEGLPYFVAEYLRAMLTGAGDHANELTHSADHQWLVPGGVLDLLRSRLASVSNVGRQVLDAGAVLGRAVDFDEIREVSGRSEDETVTALEELCHRGALVEVVGRAAATTAAYDFTHDKLRNLVLSELSLARARVLHRRAAQALERQAQRAPAAGASKADQIGHHLLAAGDTDGAAGYFRQAGDHDRALYANTEAMRHYRLALDLGHPDLAGLTEAMGDVQVLMGDYAEAIASYERVLAAEGVTATDPVTHGRIARKLGAIAIRRGRWLEADQHLTSALTALDDVGADAPEERIAIAAERCLIARHEGDAVGAQRLAEQMLTLAERTGDRRARARAHNLLGLLARGDHDPARAVVHLQQSLSLTASPDDAPTRAAALNNLALALGDLEEWARALNLAQQALSLCVSMGDRHHEAAIENNLADLLHGAGRASDAMEHLKRAVRIYAEVDAERGAAEPGIWMLAEW